MLVLVEIECRMDWFEAYYTGRSRSYLSSCHEMIIEFQNTRFET